MLQAYIAAAAVACVSAFGLGWKVKSWKVGNDHKIAMEAAVASHAEEVTRINRINETTLFNLQLEQAENVKLTAQLAGALQAARTPYRPIADDIPKAIPKCDADGSVRYDATFARLFNRAATAGTSSSGQRAGKTTGNPARELSGSLLAGAANSTNPK